MLRAGANSRRVGQHLISGNYNKRISKFCPITCMRSSILNNWTYLFARILLGVSCTKFILLHQSNCEKLKALTNRLDNLNCLQQLDIIDCLNIGSFPAEDGFATDLCSPWIDYLNIYKPLFEDSPLPHSSAAFAADVEKWCHFYRKIQQCRLLFL